MPGLTDNEKICMHGIIRYPRTDPHFERGVILKMVEIFGGADYMMLYTKRARQDLLPFASSLCDIFMK